MEKVSVLMSVYKNDKPEWFEMAVMSMVNQTITPDEIVLIVDGPVGDELKDKIHELVQNNKMIRLIENKENKGLGLTLQQGIQECKNQIIARMDADDYALPNRLEKELKFMKENDLDMVGSSVSEFIDSTDNIVSEKKVPCNQDEILKFAKSRNPFCHMTVVYKKDKVLEAGNYQHMLYCEDYYLWVRMLQKGCKVGNLDESLVLMRTTKDMYKRRGGYKYFKNQNLLFNYMRKTKFISFFACLKNKIIRFCVQVLMPNNLRQKFYEKLRKRDS